MNCDSTRAAAHLYQQAQNDLYGFIQDSSHFLRLSAYGLQRDMEYCCGINTHNVLIRLEEDHGRKVLRIPNDEQQHTSLQ